MREKLENWKREFDEAHILFHHRMNAITMPLYSNVWKFLHASNAYAKIKLKC